MSGHSKWSTIKRQKAVTDAKKGTLFTKLGHGIAIAARSGADPDMNFMLRLAIDKARAANMPLANIQRSIDRGSGKLGGDQIVEVLGDRKITERIISINEILDLVPAWEGGVFKGTLSFGINQIVGGENVDVVRRANEHVGWMWKYHITLNNCQHFAGWCLDEEFFSDEGTNPLTKKERCSETVNLPYLVLVPRWRKPL